MTSGREEDNAEIAHMIFSSDFSVTNNNRIKGRRAAKTGRKVNNFRLAVVKASLFIIAHDLTSLTQASILLIADSRSSGWNMTYS